jgi:hypothetical protein
MFDDFLKFPGKKPLALATGTDFNILAVVFDRLKKRITSGAFHKLFSNYAFATNWRNT